MEAEAGPEDDGRRERERDPLPAVELERRDHREQDERSRQRGRDHQPAPHGARAIRRGTPLRRERGLVPGGLDRADEIRNGHTAGVEANRRVLGRVVDRRLHPVELVQLPLDAVRAGGARHALEGEVDLRVALGSRDGCHAASYPASAIAARSAESSRSWPLTVTTFVSRSTATSSTPSTSETSSRIDIAQWAQWIAGTSYVTLSLTPLLSLG